MAKGKRWAGCAWIILAVVIASALGVLIFNSSLTRYVEGEAFRAELDKQTAKGLHFPAGSYGKIRRTGFFTAECESFHAEYGTKAMTKLEANGITARFNPLGVFLRRWQLDDVHLAGGEVGIQVYEPKPEPSPAKPWFHFFLPQRVYLKRVWSEPADVAWQMSGEKGGIFGTRLVITPHGRDFEYRASGGVMKTAFTPDLPMQRTAMLITKTQFSLYQLDLSSGDGALHARGQAGLREDKSVEFQVNWEKLSVREWLPAKWKRGIAGVATGEIEWKGPDLKMERAALRGALRIEGGRVRDLPFLETIAAVTRRKDFAELRLNECAAELDWKEGKGGLKKIAIEDEGKFRLEGAITLQDDSLGGEVQLGVARPYLDWLPKAEEVFTRTRGGYLWTTVHISGTLDAPKQDLSPRILDALDDTPGSFLGAVFRGFGAWLKGKKN